MLKKFLSIAIVFATLMTIMPCTNIVHAETIASGICGADGDNLTWTLDSDGTLTISGKGKMADWVLNSAPWAKNGDDILKVVINDGVTNIGNSAFGRRNNLTSVIIPNSVTSIGMYAFEYCSNLKSISIPDSVTSIREFAFYFCENLTSVGLSNNIKCIERFTFYGCEKLSNITIPDGVTNIAWDAFYDCKSLTSITIPDSVTSIGSQAFMNTAYYNDKSNWKDNVLYIDSCLIKANIAGLYSIKAGTRCIADSAFSNCTSLISVDIPVSVTNIGEEAFSYCSSLTSVTIPDSVTSIGGSVFVDCKSLINIEVDENNLNYCSVNGNLFSKDKAILIQYAIGKQDKEYLIPNSVTSIGNFAFCNCESLTSVDIPNSVISIGGYAFFNCSGLTSVTIPNSVTSIGAYAFHGCSGLTSITIPDSVTSIGRGTFWSINLTDVYYNGTEEQWNSISIEYDNNYLINATIHYNSSGLPPVPTINRPSTTITPKDDNTYTFTVNLENIDQDCNMITVLYDKNGAFVGFAQTPVKSGDTFKTVDVTAENAATAKVFIWKDLLNPAPLCSSAKVDIED